MNYRLNLEGASNKSAKLERNVSHSAVSHSVRSPLLKNAGFLRALSLAATILVSGCAGTQNVAPQAALSAQTASADATEAPAQVAGDVEAAPADVSAEAPAADQSARLAPEGDLSNASSRVLVASGKNAFGIELIDGKQTNRVVIGSELKEGDYTIQRLHSPERVVVDLFNQTSNLTKSFDTQDSALISKVRVAAHPDKNRVVLDLLGDSSVKHKAAITDGSLVVTVNSSVEARGATTQAALADTIVGEAKPEGTVVAANVPFQSPPAFELQRVADKELADANVRPTLSAVQIENAPAGGNMVVADLTNSAGYTLKKTASSEYVLTIKGASLDSSAALTLLAPPASGSIRSVRPVSAGNDVLLRVFVAPEASISAKAEGNKILLGQFGNTDTDQMVAEMRAQYAPENTVAATKETKVEKESKSPVVKDEATAKDAAKAAEAKDDSESIASALDPDSKYTGRLISLDLQDTDIDNALRIIAEVSNLNIIASEDVTGKITLRLIDVPWDQALDVILKTNGLDKVQEGNVVRIAPVEKLRQEREALKQSMIAATELEPLSVDYVRVSYAKASELKPLVESVLTERGSVAYDERTNQLIIKDIKAGLGNVAKLVGKLDLRTPQILLETQIVEANRALLRDLGSEFDFDVRMTPATGNPTSYNFPNSITVGGGGTNVGNNASSFPAAIGNAGGSALGIALGSADGTKSISAIISALETEGRARVVSRPSVATTNNKQASIKSVEKIRIKLPSGGLSVATGQGASAAGGGSTATEIVEIGITLDVTPQASPDYYVLLDIHAKSSTLGTTQVDGIPSEIERSATSTILVSSGQTFAMGGIYKITDNDTNNGVPFLKDIPVLGTLFRRSFVNNKDEELLFFLTPRIIEGSFDDAAMRAAS